MKKSIYITLLVLTLVITLGSCGNSTQKSPAVESKATEQIVYTCSMHPEIRRDKPGKCPKCGMELVRMEPADNTHMHADSNKMHSH